MNLALSQSELLAHVATGSTILVAHRAAYHIEWSHGTSSYVLRRFITKHHGAPYTLRGHFMAVTPEYYERINQY